MFVSTSAAAQEFSFDPNAMGKILAETQALKVKHNGRPAPPRILDYEARHISFNFRRDGSDRADGVILIYKSIEILYKDSLLVTFNVNSDVHGRADAERVLKAFESLRQDAIDQKRRLVIDYDAIHRQNEAGAWDQMRNPKECELFNEVIRLGIPRAGN